jgi:Tol biopolymer transport system component
MTDFGRNWAGRAVWAVLLSAALACGCEASQDAATGRAPANAPAGGGAASPAQPAAPPAVENPDPAAEPALAQIVQLTSGFERAGEAYFSPDVQWVIFQAAPRGQAHYDMYVARLRRRGDAIAGLDAPVRISPDGSWNSCGYFSPDGRSIIFASTGTKGVGGAAPGGYQRQGGNYRWSFPATTEIFHADDWQAALLGAGGEKGAAVDLAKHAITHNDAYDAECGYSPDGRWVVFSSNRDGDAELYAMRADGSDPVRLTSAKGYDGGPFFSPDGKRIVYRSDRKGNDLLQVFTADLTFGEGGRITGLDNERQLTDDANVNWGPYWHPRGRHVIYATSAHGHHNYELYWTRDDGSGRTRITHRPGFDGLPVFSPDGKWLMWSSKRTADNTTQIFAARFTPPTEAPAR